MFPCTRTVGATPAERCKSDAPASTTYFKRLFASMARTPCPSRTALLPLRRHHSIVRRLVLVHGPVDRPHHFPHRRLARQHPPDPALPPAHHARARPRRGQPV